MFKVGNSVIDLYRSPYMKGNEGVVVCVWGDDDDGMEIEVGNYDIAVKIDDSVKAPVTKKTLKELGLGRA